MIEQSETIAGELYCTPSILSNTKRIDEEIQRILRRNSLKLRFHTWKRTAFGATMFYAFGENHLVIHTYPKLGKASVDLQVSAGNISNLYSQIRYSLDCHDHDYLHLLRDIAAPCGLISVTGEFFEYRVANGLRLRIEPRRILYEGRTRYQQISIIDNVSLGKTLFLDGQFQFCEADASIYGKMMTRRIIQKNCRNVLILGGGEAQLARYLLDHSGIKKITIVEIDSDAVTIYKRFLSGVKRTLEDPRVNLVIANAVDYVLKATKRHEVYDAVVLDMTVRPINTTLEVFFGNFLTKLTRLTPLVTFYLSSLRHGWQRLDEAPLAMTLMKQSFESLNYRTSFRRAIHPAWGVVQYFGYAERGSS